MKTITFFLCEQMLATSVALPMEQFRAAESMSKAARRNAMEPLQYRLASVDGNAVKTHTGMV
jgi:hypothetical protein